MSLECLRIGPNHNPSTGQRVARSLRLALSGWALCWSPHAFELHCANKSPFEVLHCSQQLRTLAAASLASATPACPGRNWLWRTSPSLINERNVVRTSNDYACQELFIAVTVALMIRLMNSRLLLNSWFIEHAISKHSFGRSLKLPKGGSELYSSSEQDFEPVEWLRAWTDQCRLVKANRATLN